jgi:Heterokaryon incompatibility protein (HET)
MRLLHSESLELRDFPNHEGITYAILSHTWAEEEILFQDIDGFAASSMPTRVKEKQGFKKIEACCAQAVRDGFDYVWIDTCCIDKRSSAELSEAINSMYRLYQDCTICYAYLTDVPNDASIETREQKFRGSRWFTRGWTLQELIGPLNLEFYGDQWPSKGQEASLGTKYSLRDLVSEITGIPEDGLVCSDVRQSEYSTAKMMSWAANRSTTRVEDRAYSLLGLFNINMPLLYGEGSRAFVRLQEEILKVSSDETLFAWTNNSQAEVSPIPQGILAMSPDCFANSGRMIAKVYNKRRKPSTVTNKGLQLEVTLSDQPPILYEVRTPFASLEQLGKVHLAMFNCFEEQDIASSPEKRVGVLLACRSARKEEGQFLRIDPLRLFYVYPNTLGYPGSERRTIFAKTAECYDTRAAVMKIQDRHFEIENQHQVVVIKEAPREYQMIDKSVPECLRLLSGIADDYFWLTKLEKGFSGWDNSKSISLHFDNGVDAFAVAGWLKAGRRPFIQVHPRPVGLSEFGPLNPVSYLQRSDCGTCVLESGKAVSVSLRPERFMGVSFYALHISVSVRRADSKL